MFSFSRIDRKTGKKREIPVLKVPFHSNPGYKNDSKFLNLLSPSDVLAKYPRLTDQMMNFLTGLSQLQPGVSASRCFLPLTPSAGSQASEDRGGVRTAGATVHAMFPVV